MPFISNSSSSSKIPNRLYSLNWDGWGIAPTVWAVVMMVVSTAIVIVIITQRHDIAFSLVIIWALIAIAVRQMDTPLMAMTGMVMAIVLIFISAILTYRFIKL